MAAARPPTRILGDVVDAIGHTPMVELRRLSPSPRSGCSRRSRAPTRPDRSRTGSPARCWPRRRPVPWRPGQTILEPSSGNTGISLAMVGRLMGHPVRIVMPDNTTPSGSSSCGCTARRSCSRRGRGSNGAIRMAERMAAADRSLMPFQYANEANPRAHEETTGPRSWTPSRTWTCSWRGWGPAGR